MDTSIAESADKGVEEAFIAALFHDPNKLGAVLQDFKLKPDTFFYDSTRKIYHRMLALYEQGTPATLDLVCSDLPSEIADYARTLNAAKKEAGAIKHFAKRLIELEKWRVRGRASLEAIEAVKIRDFERYVKARSLDQDTATSNDSYYDAKRLAEEFKEYLKGDQAEVFKLPFNKLNKVLGGGFRRQQMTIVGGWTSHGKSVVVDQFLQGFSDQGLRTHLYMNEMSHQERVVRVVARKTGIPTHKIMTSNLTLEEQASIDKTLKDGLPFSITPCAGWSIEELSYDIRNREFDVVAVDVLHLFDYESELELARISRLLNRVAKTANCHVIATVHLNEGRVNDITRPRPVTRDIRGSGMLKNDADNVMFVYREQDPTSGDPQPSSTLYLAKARSGMLGKADAMFNNKHLRFEEVTS